MLDEASSPRSIETEAAVLGAMMCEPRFIDIAADKLRVESFCEQVHGVVFSSIVARHSAGKIASPMAIAESVPTEMLACVGGKSYLAKLTSTGVGFLDFTGFCDHLVELATRRHIISAANDTISLARDQSVSMDEVSAAVESAVEIETADGTIETDIGGAVDQLFARYAEKSDGVISGIDPFDDLTGGLKGKQFVILAGRPGMGKTACSMSYSIGAARKGYGVLFISLEMGAAELAGRAMADIAHSIGHPIPYGKIEKGHLTAEERSLLREIREEMNSLPFQIIDTGRLTVGNLGMRVRRHKRRFAAMGQSLDLVVVDYLQLIRPTKDRGGRYEDMTMVSQELKSIAKENDVPVMALAQLSRQVESRVDKRPMLSDLRDSGQIEQDADMVMFLLRDEYYIKQCEPVQTDPKWSEWDQALRASRDKLEFILAKRRNGPTGSAIGHFYSDYQAVRS